MLLIHVLASWQTWALVAIAVASLLAARYLVDIALGEEHGLTRLAVREGADIRAQRPLLDKLLLPMVPLVVPGLLCWLTPLRPPALEGLAALYLFSWGGCCGTIGDWIYDFYQGLRNANRANRAG